MTFALRGSTRASESTTVARSGRPAIARVSVRSDVRVVTAESEFLALGSEWNELVGNSRRPSVFLRHEWFEAVWQWQKCDSSPFVLLWLRDGALAAVLPLAIRADGLRSGAVRSLEFLMAPDSQLCDVITRAGDESAAASAFVDALVEHRRAWDVFRVRGVPRGGAAAALVDAFRQRGFVTDALEPDRNLYIPLGGGWEDYYKNRSRSLKKANNLAVNRLQRAGEVSVEWLAPGARTPPSDLDRTIATVIDISARSWKGNIATGLDKPGPQAFIRRLSERANDQGWLSVWTVRLNGRPVAMEYQLVADGNVYALRGDFDAACDTISPGSYLSRQLLERLFGQGLRRYFLGPGENEYKLRWTDQAELLDDQRIYGRTMRGHWLALWRRCLKPCLRAVRDGITRHKNPPVLAKPDQEDA